MVEYNKKCPAVKRLMREAIELVESTDYYYAQPIEDNLFDWHFTIRGPLQTDFAGGIYHGRIVLPPEYPMKPPSIFLITKNGRFQVGVKICLSISGHHPETWQPSWSIRTALLALIGFMPSNGEGAIGSLDYRPDERQLLAKKSLGFVCEHCGAIRTHLKPLTESNKNMTEAKELAKQIQFKGEETSKQTPTLISPERSSEPEQLQESVEPASSQDQNDVAHSQDQSPPSSDRGPSEDDLTVVASAGVVLFAILLLLIRRFYFNAAVETEKLL